MNSYLPSQVVRYIDSQFSAPKQQAETGCGDGFYIERNYAPQVNQILKMVRGVPSHLLILDGDAVLELEEAIEAVQAASKTWEQGNFSLKGLPHRNSLHPLAIIRKHLGTLRDEGIDSKTAELRTRRGVTRSISRMDEIGIFPSSNQPGPGLSKETDLPAIFVRHAADILGETGKGFSGSQIVTLTAAYAIDHDITLPHSNYPFDAANKRSALFDNLMAFPVPIRYRIILELCNHEAAQKHNKEAADALRIKLVTRYGHLDDRAQTSDINPKLIEETRHWLNSFPEALELYSAALEKHNSRIFIRNLLDDLRLALEKLVRAILRNEKSLENQFPSLGQFVKESGGSPEFSNMFVKLIDYYSKYQNTYVKHDDAVIEEEVEFVFEITSSFMKHLVRLHDRETG